VDAKDGAKQKRWTWPYARLRRWLVAAVALLLAAARIADPQLNIDVLTLELVAVAGAALLLPDIAAVIPYLKTVKLPGIEFELRELSEAVENARKHVPEEPAAATVPDPEVDSEENEILKTAATNPRAGLLLASAVLEREVRKRLRAASVNAPPGLPRAVEAGVRARVFDPSLLAAVREFSTLRNRIAHGEAPDVSDADVTSMVSLGLELLALVRLSGLAKTSAGAGDESEAAMDGQT
jgi:hypothetical protein